MTHLAARKELTASAGGWLGTTTMIVLASILAGSVAAAQVRDGLATQRPIGAPGQAEVAKTIVSGGPDMGTYIMEVQANFGKADVVVALPSKNTR